MMEPSESQHDEPRHGAAWSAVLKTAHFEGPSPESVERSLWLQWSTPSIEAHDGSSMVSERTTDSSP